MKPKRIQLSRSKGWRMPPNTVKVTRPGKWGNPFKVGTVSTFGDVPDAEAAVTFYRTLFGSTKWMRRSIVELRGKNLACWCPIGSPCHADVLLEVANA